MTGNRIVDLFCGAGGLSLGFKDKDFELVYAVDNDQLAVDHYNKSVADVAVCLDVMELDLKDLPEADGIVGGPPCQAFSLARALTPIPYCSC